MLPYKTRGRSYIWRICLVKLVFLSPATTMPDGCSRSSIPPTKKHFRASAIRMTTSATGRKSRSSTSRPKPARRSGLPCSRATAIRIRICRSMPSTVIRIPAITPRVMKMARSSLPCRKAATTSERTTTVSNQSCTGGIVRRVENRSDARSTESPGNLNPGIPPLTCPAASKPLWRSPVVWAKLKSLLTTPTIPSIV